MSKVRKYPEVFEDGYLDENAEEIEELNLLHEIYQQLDDTGYSIVKPFNEYNNSYLISRTEGLFTKIVLSLRLVWCLLGIISVLCIVAWIYIAGFHAVIGLFFEDPARYENIDTEMLFLVTIIPAVSYLIFEYFFFKPWCDRRMKWEKIQNKIGDEKFNAEIQRMSKSVKFKIFRPTFSNNRSNVSGIINIVFKSGQRTEPIYFEGRE